MPDTYTDEELQALPQTPTVLETPQMDFDKHTWVQQGYTVIDTCGSHPGQSIAIPSGTMLIKKDGRYSLVDEMTRQ